jgi:heme exporter protein C
MEVRQAPKSSALTWLGAAAWTAVALALGFIFFVAREAPASMGGQLQRIFYIHVPSAWVAYLAFAIVFLSSVAYLKTGARRWDLLAHSAAELGVLFLAWDARLTSTLLLWLTYVGYLVVRNLASDESHAGRLAAVVGIVGLVEVPIVHFSVYWWRTLHPQGPTVADPVANSGLGAPELLAFFTSLIAFTLLFAWLLALRVRLGHLADEVEDLESAPPGAWDRVPVAT